MINALKYLTQSIIVVIFFFIGKLIGLKNSRIIFSKLFLLMGPRFKSKKIINDNLKNFKKNITSMEEEEIISNMWKNYGMTFIEYIFLKNFRNNNSHISFKGEEILENIFQNNKPVIFVSGHFANFELMSMEITKKNINLATIYRPLNNFFLNPVMEYLREKYVCKNQIKKGINGLRETIEYIKKDYSIALMIDQRLSEGDKINFFGKPASTTTLPAQLAFKYNLPIIPVFIQRINSENFQIEFFEKIFPKNFKNKIELSQKLNYVLEDMIKKNPNEWIWTHSRWK